MIKKNFFGMMVLITGIMMAFTLAGCGDDGGGNGNGNGNGGGGTDNSAQLAGTWVKGTNYAVEFAISGNSKTYKMGGWFNGSFNGTPTNGTFTYLGTTLSFIVGDMPPMPGTATVSENTLTLSGFGSPSDGAYTKQ
ncbi:MAG: hypothetical protein LBI04_02960 [Treponema sp.]|jgi:hypothetical protein|nr:hypothetical protein [Treponema sp.]